MAISHQYLHHKGSPSVTSSQKTWYQNVPSTIVSEHDIILEPRDELLFRAPASAGTIANASKRPERTKYYHALIVLTNSSIMDPQTLF